MIDTGRSFLKSTNSGGVTLYNSMGNCPRSIIILLALSRRSTSSGCMSARWVLLRVCEYGRDRFATGEKSGVCGCWLLVTRIVVMPHFSLTNFALVKSFTPRQMVASQQAAISAHSWRGYISASCAMDCTMTMQFIRKPRVKAIERLKSPNLPIDGNSSSTKLTGIGNLPSSVSRRAYCSRREKIMVKNREDRKA